MVHQVKVSMARPTAAGRPGRRCREGGVVYLWLLFMVFLLSLGVGQVLEIYSTQAQRDREVELLHVGNLYRQAIRNYYLSSPGRQKQYPVKLELLLRDPRYLTPRRYLRRLYPDPLTGQPFMTIRAPAGGIMGVSSSSTKVPRKQAGFSFLDAGFAQASSYRDWQFIYMGGP